MSYNLSDVFSVGESTNYIGNSNSTNMIYKIFIFIPIIMVGGCLYKIYRWYKND